MFDLPHAETHSAVLPQVTARNAPTVPDPAARLAAALGADDLATGVFDLAERVGSPTSLRALGLREEDLDAAAAAVEEATGEPVAASCCSERGRVTDRLASRERARFGPAGGGGAGGRLTICRQRVGRRRAESHLSSCEVAPPLARDSRHGDRRAGAGVRTRGPPVAGAGPSA